MLIRNMQAALHRGLPLLARARTAERRARIDHLKSLEKALGACAKLLVERTASKQHTVGRLIGAEIARSLTNDAYWSVGIAIGLSLRDAEMIRARAREPDAEIASEERRLRGTRSAESPLTWPEVHARVRLSRTTVWRLEGAGGSPKRVRTSPARVAWRETEIGAFVAGTWKREHGEP